MPAPRVTIRRLMSLVAAAACAAWLGRAAWVVSGESPRELWHIWFHPATGELAIDGHAEFPTFWPVYWRALLGWPWTRHYPCSCRARPRPGWTELAVGDHGAEVLALHKRLVEPSRRAWEHRFNAEWLESSAARDAERVRDADARARRQAAAGHPIQGADWVRRTLRDGIEESRRRARYHRRLAAHYDRAALRPWLPLAPEPPPPWEVGLEEDVPELTLPAHMPYQLGTTGATR